MSVASASSASCRRTAWSREDLWPEERGPDDIRRVGGAGHAKEPPDHRHHHQPPSRHRRNVSKAYAERQRHAAALRMCPHTRHFDRLPPTGSPTRLSVKEFIEHSDRPRNTGRLHRLLRPSQSQRNRWKGFCVAQGYVPFHDVYRRRRLRQFPRRVRARWEAKGPRSDAGNATCFNTARAGVGADRCRVDGSQSGSPRPRRLSSEWHDCLSLPRQEDGRGDPEIRMRHPPE